MDHIFRFSHACEAHGHKVLLDQVTPTFLPWAKMHRVTYGKLTR
ncbi:MAG: hypothetical protein ACRDRJ_03655 [Streptosporangiaceae bacterium]